MKNLIDLYNDEIKSFISVGEIKEIPFFKKEPLFYIFDKELLSNSIKTENCIEKEFVVEKLDNESSSSCKILRFNKNSSVFRLEKDLKIIDEIIILLNDILQKVSKNEVFDSISVYFERNNITIITTIDLSDFMLNDIYKYFSEKLHKVQDRNEIYKDANLYSFNVIY